MKRKILIYTASLLAVASFTGCTEQKKDSSQTENITVSITENTTDTLSYETTIETDIQISETTETSSFNTELSETQTDTKISEPDESSIKNVSSENSETEQPEETKEITYEDIISGDAYFQNLSDTTMINDIEMYYNKSELTEECLSAISSYLKSMQERNAQTYESFMIPVYKDHLNEYLAEMNHTTQTLLDTNYENISAITGGDFIYKKAEFKVLSPEDYEFFGLPDYPGDYIKQLDEISYSADETYISESFSNYYGIMCNIYAETAGTEYCVISQKVITVFESEEQYYIMM